MDKEIADFRKIARKRLVQLVKEAENTLERSRSELEWFESHPTETGFIIGFESSHPPEEFGCGLDWDVFDNLRDCLNETSKEGQQKILSYANTLHWEELRLKRQQVC